MDRIDVTGLFRLLRKFQRNSSASFAGFHEELGLKLTLENTESSQAFEAAIQAVAEIKLRQIADDYFRQPEIECDIVDTADDSGIFFEELENLGRLQACPKGIAYSTAIIRRFEALYDLDNRIPRHFDYVQMSLSNDRGNELNQWLIVPFEQVRFYLKTQVDTPDSPLH